MAEVPRSAETETSCDISIAIEDNRTSMERRTMSPMTDRPPPPPPLPEVAEDYHLAETETSCDVLGQKRFKQKIDRSPSGLECAPYAKYPGSRGMEPGSRGMEHGTISRLPPQLVEVNKEAYRPYVISFGPYHHPCCLENQHLNEMEGRKAQSLNSLLERANQSRDEIRRSDATRKIVEEAQNCYSARFHGPWNFQEMLLRDGCFIIQLIMGTLEDPFCPSNLIYASLLRDLVLVENQLPFFVLCKILDTIPETFCNLRVSSDPKNSFISDLLERFKDALPGLRVDRTYDDDSIKNVKHIGHLLHSNWRPSDNARTEYENRQKDGKWRFIRPATELREAGIEFKMAETEGNERQSLFDIKFEKGILEMPKLTIEDDTESLFRNLIACEQLDNELPLYLVDYVVLMNSLINTGKDVELLCQSKIIDNWLGDDESVAVLFNRLGDHARFSKQSFFYAQLFNDINKHYYKTSNKWKADLMLKYFNTPWAFISFLAATFLLLFTVLQTTFTIFPRS